MTAPIGWDDPGTAAAYEQFCRRHPRYRIANDALIAHAVLGPGQRVLDVAAGTGRTARTALPLLGESGLVVCVEPATAMRALGERRVHDTRVRWTDVLPEREAFDRVLCGAAIWQLTPLESALERLSSLMAPEGALVFNMPASYLLEADPPGGGRDPYLTELTAVVERSTEQAAYVATPAQSASEIDWLLVSLGLQAERWSFTVRLTQIAYRDWLKIPPVSEGFLAGLAPDERARRLDDAYRRTDHASWRTERWIGWTAWRRR
jgi:SAM-dependent methyltransferase